MRPLAPYPAGVTWTITEKRVFKGVFDSAARTTRSLIAEYGPKPNWARLLSAGWIQEWHTVYGPVVTLGPEARAEVRAHSSWPQSVCLNTPSGAADRAYQMDAVELLLREGYRVVDHVYKRAGGVGGAAPTHIVAVRLRVPDQRMEALQERWPGGQPYARDHTGLAPEVLGHPLLYATVSGGGIRVPRLKALLKKHAEHIDEWRHPLLVAVPEEGNLRAYLRAHEAKQNEVKDGIQRRDRWYKRPTYPHVRLIVLPRPNNVRRSR